MSENRLKRHVNYSLKELEEYINLPNSCVYKINTNLHVSILPYSLEDFKRHLLLYIIRKKVSFYDAQVDGIVLDIRNIKVLNTIAAMRANDPNLHVDLNADFYVFRPVVNALVTGLVKYISAKIVGVTIYKVFSAQIRFATKIDKSQVFLGQELEFRIKDFDLQNVFPYIMGELPGQTEVHVKKERVKRIKFEDEEENDVIEKETEDLDKLIGLIEKQTAKSKKRKHERKSPTPVVRKRKYSATVEDTADIKIKKEKPDDIIDLVTNGNSNT